MCLFDILYNVQGFFFVFFVVVVVFLEGGVKVTCSHNTQYGDHG